MCAPCVLEVGSLTNLSPNSHVEGHHHMIAPIQTFIQNINEN